MNTSSTDTIVTTLDRALRDPEPFNRHAKRLMRLSRDQDVAAVASRLLSGWNASLVQAIDHEGHLDEYTVMGTVLRAAADGLPNVDVSDLNAALDAAIATAWNLPNAHAPNLHMRRQHPAAFVTAAYVLARDLRTVDFDCEHPCSCSSDD